MRASWVAKTYKTYARPELYASPPLEALKVVLSEIATGKRGGKSLHWLTCEGRTSTLHHEEEYLSNLPPEDYQAGDEHMCGLLQYCLSDTRDAAQNWEEELASTLSDLKLTRGIVCPCVWKVA